MVNFWRFPYLVNFEYYVYAPGWNRRYHRGGIIKTVQPWYPQYTYPPLPSLIWSIYCPPPPLCPDMVNISSFHGCNGVFKRSAPLSALLWSIYGNLRNVKHPVVPQQLWTIYHHLKTIILSHHPKSLKYYRWTALRHLGMRSIPHRQGQIVPRTRTSNTVKREEKILAGMYNEGIQYLCPHRIHHQAR